ncbi:MAG: flippase-like domain-containing protein [Bacteroidota bacterium]|nr:flippase-like domain-containing protein [Bacteroidota bacterium]
MPSLFKTILQFILFLGLGIVIMWWIFHQQSLTYHTYCVQNNISAEDCNLWKKLYADIKTVHWPLIACVFVSFIISNLSRAKRWQIIFSSIGNKIHYINSFGAVLVAYLVNLGIPRSGEFVRAGLISKYENISFDKSFGTIILDRIIDMICMCLLIGVFILLQWNVFLRFYNEQFSSESLFKKIAPLLLIFGFFAFLYFTRSIWRNWKLARWLSNKIKGLMEGILAIRTLDRPFSFVFHTVIVWVGYYMMLFFALKAFPPTSQISPLETLGVYVFGAMGMVVPTPGGMGSYQFLIIMALSYYGINEVDAFSFSNIAFFSAQFATNIILGIFGFALLSWFNKKEKQFIST